MQFAALVEYLVSGIVGSVWIAAIVNEFIPIKMGDIKEFKEIVVVVYFPIAYILGIYVDVISSYVIRRVKEFYKLSLNKNIFKKVANICSKIFYFIAGTPKSDPYKNASIILSYSPSDLVKTMDAYVSRDRMARGMALNSFISAFVSLWVLPCHIARKAFVVSLIVFFVSILIWRRLRRLSSTFKKVAIKVLNENGENRVKP